MIRVKTNIGIVTASMLRKLEALRDPKPLLRPVAQDVLTMMADRIHEQGIASDGGPIGTYSRSYLELRRRKYKRSSDPTVILSLTRRMQNDWGVIATDRGWGVGFLTRESFEKLAYVEKQKGKKIGSPTKAEKDYALTKLKSLLQQELSR
jgi:hypothetical protein